MFYECDNGNCRLGAECGNRNFSELKNRTKAGGKYNIGVEVIKTEDRGYGVRSNRSFEPNQIIVEYTGEIITQFECERRMRNVYKNNEVSKLPRIWCCEVIDRRLVLLFDVLRSKHDH
jgi:histone-lysine N-methyltransferase ASH1L